MDVSGTPGESLEVRNRNSPRHRQPLEHLARGVARWGLWYVAIMPESDYLGLRLVLVEWEDSQGVGQSWEFLDANEPPEVLKCKSVGWLLYESKERITVLPHIAQTPRGQGCGDMTIPRSAILSCKTLEVSETRRRKAGRRGAR
jgi:hypothetical protein